MSNGSDPILELSKMEYEKGATRYEDIYKASWTNFSYLAAVSGAILAFGGDKFGLVGAGILASVPLLFWYWATFEPLNEYGDKVVDELKNIEERLNDTYKTELKIYTQFAKRAKQHAKIDKYIIYPALVLVVLAAVVVIICQRCGVLNSNSFRILTVIIISLAVIVGIALVCLGKLRVRYVIRFFFFFLHITVAALLLSYFCQPKQPEVKTVTITLKDDKGEVKLTEIELEKLKELLDSIRK
ncbi:MAG: hypothetical protein AB1631_07385 [Acidobacteriota bacterium]